MISMHKKKPSLSIDMFCAWFVEAIIWTSSAPVKDFLFLSRLRTCPADKNKSRRSQLYIENNLCELNRLFGVGTKSILVNYFLLKLEVLLIKLFKGNYLHYLGYLQKRFS